MRRLIDADKLIEEKRKKEEEKWGKPKWQKGHPSYAEMIFTESEIENAPTVEERKHGHWIWSDWFYRKNATVPCRQVNCSICNGFADVYEGQKAKRFCGECGAIMDEVSEDEKI